MSSKNVIVILCSSLISMMEAQTLNYSSPLYGRRTAQIRLQPLSFASYSEFFPEMSLPERIERYSVTGGVPKYVELFRGEGSIDELIAQNVLSPSSFLHDEPRFLLQREVTEVGTYFSIIKTIAAENQKLSRISAALEAKQTSLTKYLRTLIDLDILARNVPVTESQPDKSKRGLYRVKDHFILFWFRFVFPYLNYIELGQENYVLEHLKAHFIDSHVSFVYEQVCRERLWSWNAEGRLPFALQRVGRWWDGSHEIDLGALDQTGENILLGECKYKKSKMGLNVLHDLEEKARCLSSVDEKVKITSALFSIAGFDDELTELAQRRRDVMLGQG